MRNRLEAIKWAIDYLYFDIDERPSWTGQPAYLSMNYQERKDKAGTHQYVLVGYTDHRTRTQMAITEAKIPRFILYRYSCLIARFSLPGP